MAEIAEKRKKIYKLATELNLSHETLVDFLRKKGHEVKNHMSSVDDDMMRDILVHFKKEKDSAEKHQRKMAEIKESKKKVEKKVEEPVTPTAPVVPVDTTPAVVSAAGPEEEVVAPVEVSEVVKPAATPEPEPVIETAEAAAPEPSTGEVVPAPAVEAC